MISKLRDFLKRPSLKSTTPGSTALRVGLAAIVRNEAEYLVEWIAWHRNAGFTDFLFSDNESDDGTRELLDALAAAGVVRVRSQPRAPYAQVKAYNAMLEAWGGDLDRIAFLDADEFLVTSDGSRAVDQLESLICPEDVGAIAINWRLFGSAGQLQRKPGLVVERFTRCAADDHPKSVHVKTYSKPHVIAEQRVHRANIKPEFRYLDAAGMPMDFASSKPGRPGNDGEKSRHTGPSGLRVHHYVVKSLQEFEEKKRNRGDANIGPDANRHAMFFAQHDLNDLECTLALSGVEATRQTMQQIQALIDVRHT